MIYLFCNSGFGEAFRRECVRQCRASGEPLTIVYSTRTPPRAVSRVRTAVRNLRLRYHTVRNQLRDGFPLRHIADVNDPVFIRSIERGSSAVIAGFNQIFGRDLIAQFQSVVNFHPSILPQYRGPVPSYWCLRNGERWTGFTLHRVTELIDSGEILHQETVEVGSIEEPSELDQRIARTALPTLIRYLEHLRNADEWPVVTLQANSIYSSQVRYASFPEIPSRD